MLCNRLLYFSPTQSTHFYTHLHVFVLCATPTAGRPHALEEFSRRPKFCFPPCWSRAAASVMDQRQANLESQMSSVSHFSAHSAIFATFFFFFFVLCLPRDTGEMWRRENGCCQLALLFSPAASKFKSLELKM